VLDSRTTSAEILALLPRATGYCAEVGERLQWFLHFTEHRSVSATCRHFAIARTTFYRWARRFDPADLAALEDLPTAPLLYPLPETRTLERQSAEEPLSAPLWGHRPPPAITPSPLSGHWRSIRRGVLILSVVANVFFIAAFLTIAWMESHNISSSSLSAQATDAPVPSYSADSPR
jgi:hypothetical protein